MKQSERNARGEGYLDGLEGRNSRHRLYSPESYANAYTAGHLDGLTARERAQRNVRKLAALAFSYDDEEAKRLRGSTAEEARNPNFIGLDVASGTDQSAYVQYGKGTITGRWSGGLLSNPPRRVGKHPALAAPYGGDWSRPNPVRMVATDIVPEGHPWFPRVALLQMEDEKRRAYVWMQMYHAIHFTPPAGFVRIMDEIFPEDAAKTLSDAMGATDCPKCGGDCGAANPPVTDCPRDTARYRKD